MYLHEGRRAIALELEAFCYVVFEAGVVRKATRFAGLEILEKQIPPLRCGMTNSEICGGERFARVARPSLCDAIPPYRR
jgi:hypothetical protein